MQRSNLKLVEHRKKPGGSGSSEWLGAYVWAERISIVGLFALAIGYTLFVLQELFVPVVTAWVMGAIFAPDRRSWREAWYAESCGRRYYGDGCAPDTSRNHRTSVYAPCLLDWSHRSTCAADKGEVATTKSALGGLR